MLPQHHIGYLREVLDESFGVLAHWAGKRAGYVNWDQFLRRSLALRVLPGAVLDRVLLHRLMIIHDGSQALLPRGNMGPAVALDPHRPQLARRVHRTPRHYDAGL